jgi:transposase
MLHRTAKLTPFGRRLLVDRIVVEGWAPAIAAETVGVSRATAYKWLRRYRAEGLTGLEKPRRNAFQNLDESNRLWLAAIGRSYPDMLTDGEHRDLVRLVQQRHVLAHQDGAVDQAYLDKAGDRR